MNLSKKQKTVRSLTSGSASDDDTVGELPGTSLGIDKLPARPPSDIVSSTKIVVGNNQEASKPTAVSGLNSSLLSKVKQRGLSVGSSVLGKMN